MRVVQLALLLAGACSHAPKANNEAAPPPAPDAVIAVAPTDATMTKDAAPPSDPCALLTAQDLADLCGVADATISADEGEGTAGKPVCSRKASVPSGDWLSVVLWRTDEADARQRFEDHRPAGRVGNGWIKISEVELGDRAELEHNHLAMESQTITVRVLRGPDYLAVWQRKRDGKSAVCTDDQLVELAKRAVSRMVEP